jgi:hypothetical protein
MAEMDIIGYFRSASLLTIAIRGIGYGLVLASFIAFFVSLTNKKIVKRLLDREALSRDTAANAEDIGGKSGFGRLALRDRSTLRKTVEATEISEGAGGEKRYYIPEETADGAEIRYVKKGSPVGWIVGMVLLAAATEGAVFALPWILSSFN